MAGISYGAMGEPPAPDLPDGRPPIGRLVMIFATPSIPEGVLVKGMLEAEGIPVAAKGEAEGPYRVGPVYLWVPEELEVQARMIIEDARSGHRQEPVEAEEGDG